MKSATVAEKMNNPSSMPRATHRPGHQPAGRRGGRGHTRLWPHSDDPPSNISRARLIVQMSYWSKGQHRPKSVPFSLRAEVEPQCQLPVIGTEDLAAGTIKEACVMVPDPTHRSLYPPTSATQLPKSPLISAASLHVTPLCSGELGTKVHCGQGKPRWQRSKAALPGR